MVFIINPIIVILSNDLENEFYLKGADGVDLDFLTLVLLLYADDIVIFAKPPEELEAILNNLENYCKRWKLNVNKHKTKVMIFRKDGQISPN